MDDPIRTVYLVEEIKVYMNMNRFLLGLVIATAIALVVFAAISADKLLDLVGGIIALGVIAIALAWIGVKLYARWADAQHKRDSLKLAHIERMADKGLLLTGRGVPTYTPLQLTEPEDVSVSVQGVTDSVVAPYQRDALELLALSKQIMPQGENSTQIAPFYKARQDSYFKDVAVWTSAVQFLLIKQLADERYKEGKNGRKKEGTFVRHGTVGQVYEMMRKSAPSPLLD